MKANVIASIIAVAIIGGAYFFVDGSTSSGPTNTNSKVAQVENTAPVNNVNIVNGKQIIEIKAKGGYQPRKSIAKAGIPTILRFDTSGTFDCSSSVRIPTMGISKSLPQTGTTDIEIGTPKTITLQGTCGMGMYPFEVNFQG
jgi:plastocyanin domain-containing protein